MPFIDLTGQRYGTLTVIERAPNRKSKACWLCQCDCGARKEVRAANLRNGNTHSCGCGSVRFKRTHGMTSTPEYGIWTGMKRRCLNPRDSHWENYGGRGISICERWLNSFENFYADMGKRPSPDLSIDRYPNNDGNYEPANCRWATKSQQNATAAVQHIAQRVTLSAETTCASDLDGGQRIGSAGHAGVCSRT